MNPIQAVLGALAALAAFPAIAGAQAPATPAPETFWGKPVHGLQAGIRIAGGSATVHIGDRIKIELVLRNTTDHDIDFAHGNAQRIYGWQVKQQKDGVWEIAPRWRYWHELKLEGVVAGAIGLRLAAGTEMAVPLDAPEIVVTERPPQKPEQSERRMKLFVTAKPGTQVQLRALPITAAVRGEEWLDLLVTGTLKLQIRGDAASAEKPTTKLPDLTDVAWGAKAVGLQAGIRFADGKKPLTTGDRLWMDLYVRNSSAAPLTVSYQTGSIYIDPPVEAAARTGRCEVIGGTGQIVRPFTTTLGPGEAALIGHPNYVLYPRVQRSVHGMSVYPEMNIDSGAVRMRQSFPVEIGGRSVHLTSGTLDLVVEPHKSPIAWGPAEQGFRVGIGFQDGRDRFHLGDTASLFVYVQNVSKSEKRFARLTNPDPLPVECRDAAGNEVEVRHSRTTLLPTDQTLTLKPGEIAILSAPEVDILTGFRMPAYPSSAMVGKPGRFTFVLPRVTEFSRPGEPARPIYPSGELPFTILPK